MPGFDRTGPAGRGPMTGWDRGLCRGKGGAGSFGRGIGRGIGRGRGPGGGMGLPRVQGMVQADEYSAAGLGETNPSSAEAGSEVADLKRQVGQAAELIDGLMERIAALEVQK